MNDNKTNGKGSKPRPFSISFKEFQKNWDKIFKKKKDETDVKLKTKS